MSQIEDPVAAKNASKRLESMLGYAETTNCRREYLLRYFGEQLLEREQPCCDRCERSEQPRRAVAPERRDQRQSKKHSISLMHRTKSLHRKAYALWSRQEEFQLTTMFENGYTTQQIAQELERNAGAIRSRLRKLGVVDSARKPPAQGEQKASRGTGRPDPAAVESAVLSFLQEFRAPLFSHATRTDTQGRRLGRNHRDARHRVLRHVSNFYTQVSRGGYGRNGS